MLKWTQIAENFLAIDVGKEYDEKPLYRTTFYYYKGLIIDTGCPHTGRESVDFVGDRKLDVKAVLLTHYHEDHSGGAYLFKERFNVNVFAPEKSMKILASPPEVPAYRQLVWGHPKPLEALPLERKMTFDDVTFAAFDTPGHSFDHVSLLIDDFIFVGDLVTGPTPIIIMREEDSIDLIDSLKMIAGLDFKRAFGGHGCWDKEDIKLTLNNMLKLKEKIDGLWRIGLNADQIVEKVFSNVPKKALLLEEISECEWSRKNLVESMLGMRHKPPSSADTR